MAYYEVLQNKLLSFVEKQLLMELTNGVTKGVANGVSNGVTNGVSVTESQSKARLAILELAHMMSVPMSLIAVINLKVPEAIWQGGSNTPLSASQILTCIRPHGGGDAENLQRILRLLTSYNIFVEHLSNSGERKYSLTDISKTLVDDKDGLSYAYYMLQHHEVNFFNFILFFF